MSESDLRKITAWVDTALEVIQHQPGKLNVRDVTVRSMLQMIRSELEESTDEAKRRRALRES